MLERHKEEVVVTIDDINYLQPPNHYAITIALGNFLGLLFFLALLFTLSLIHI